LSLLTPRAKALRPCEAAESLAAAALALSAVFIALNEGFANWQAVWTALALIALAVTLWRAPGARKPRARRPRGGRRGPPFEDTEPKGGGGERAGNRATEDR